MGRGPDREVTRSDVLDAMRSRSDPRHPWTASELQDEIGCSSGTVYNRLRELDTQGRIETKKVGARARIWWIPNTDATIDTGDTERVTPGLDTELLETMASRVDVCEPWTTSELEDTTGRDKNTIYNHLRELEDSGYVASTKVGARARVWWVAEAPMEEA